MAKRETTATAGLTRRQLSRKRREERFQRAILIGAGIVAAAVLALVGIYAYTRVSEPRKVLATVGDETITVGEFQDRVWFEYYLYQIQGMAQFGLPFDSAGVMDQMVEDIVLREKAAEMDIEVTEDEIEERGQLLFGFDAGEPEPTSTAFPTSAPTSDATPTATSTFVYTPTPSATPTLDPSITPTVTPEATEEATGEPDEEATSEATEEATAEATAEATEQAPTETPFPTPTPIDEAEFNTRLSDFLTNGATLTGLSEARMREILDDWIRSALIREKLREEADFDLDETKPLVHAAHILVATEEEANAALERLEAGEALEELAAEISIDTSNAYRGGDLGWFGPGRMVEVFEDAVFSTPAGEISEPVQTEFGWHIIKVYERTEEPTTDFDREAQRQELLQEQIDQWKEEAGVEIDENFTDYLPAIPQAQQPVLP